MSNFAIRKRDRVHVRPAWLLFAAGSLASFPGHCSDRNETSGDVLRVALPAAAFALAAKRRDREGRLGFYRSFGANVIATAVLKQAVHKRRPDGNDDDAFPSGHASMAFQGAGFIHRRYGIRQAWPAYVAASWVAWTRIDANRHDVVDVLGGAALGVGTAFLFARRAPNVSVSGLVGPGRIDFSVSGQFGAGRHGGSHARAQHRQ